MDITGGEPPSTYEATIRLGLEDPRIHALVLGYWHTIVTPPMVFAELTARVVAEAGRRGIEKPVVASLAGDIEVEEACQYLFERGVVAYPYTTEKPVAVLGAKYRWARAAGLLGGGSMTGLSPERGTAGRWRRADALAAPPAAPDAHTKGDLDRGRWPDSLPRKGCST